LWASVIGYLAFGEIPDLWTWIGGTIIFASTTYIAYREAALRRAPD
jgi:drug/metabolite transporter (DMT)-like permease